MIVHLACNDWRNGSPQGWADAVKVGALSFVGGRVSVALEKPHDLSRFPLRLRVGHVQVPALAYREWYGNWCWDAVEVRKVDALRIVNYLLRRQTWHIEEAPSELYDRLTARKALTPNEWRDADVTD